MPCAGGIIASLIHISDLHFGGRISADEQDWKRLKRAGAETPLQGLYGHSFEKTFKLTAYVKSTIDLRRSSGIPVCVVFTGDLTRTGSRGQFVTGTKFLTESTEVSGENWGLGLGKPLDVDAPRGLFLIPGNHDVWRKSLLGAHQLYRKFFAAAFPLEMKITTSVWPVWLYGLDSTRTHRLLGGDVPKRQIDGVCGLLEQRRGTAFQVVCLHHPLRDPPEPAWMDPLLRLRCRDQIAAQLARSGANLVLSGHVHQYSKNGRESERVPSHVIAGTAAQQFARKWNFVLIDIYRDGIRILRIDYNSETASFQGQWEEEDLSW